MNQRPMLLFVAGLFLAMVGFSMCPRQTMTGSMAGNVPPSEVRPRETDRANDKADPKPTPGLPAALPMIFIGAAAVLVVAGIVLQRRNGRER